MRSREDLIELAETYFARVDAKDLPGVLALLTPDCRMTIETFGVKSEKCWIIWSGSVSLKGFWRGRFGPHIRDRAPA